ncbi:uncharacterized protein LOC124107704, partial [Marmota monax]|uniref:uncharacterized protein LOC124107704 n=1 Tax=Marmota monax TaxID=9995 RepID=UPI0026F2EF0E
LRAMLGYMFEEFTGLCQYEEKPGPSEWATDASSFSSPQPLWRSGGREFAHSPSSPVCTLTWSLACADGLELGEAADLCAHLFLGSVPISSWALSPTREETITTVVKSPRGPRRSPSKSPSRSPSHRSTSPQRPVLLAPDLLFLPGSRQPHRPETEPGRKPTVPTLYVTEAEAPSGALPGGTGPQPKWLEVEETVEVRVKKSGPQAVSPAREVPRGMGALLFTLPGGTPGGDPNANNSNNKQLDQEPHAQGPAVVRIGEPLVFHVDAGGSVDWAASGAVSPEPEETGASLRDSSTEWAGVEGDGESPFVVEEPQDTDGLCSRDPKILTHNGRVLTLADLEDYVPQAGETFGCRGPASSTSDDMPCEVSVLQREISEPTVGQPILLNVGRPPRHVGPPGFFRTGSQVHSPEDLSFHMRGARAGPVGSAPWTSSCTRVQHSTDGRQSSFKTEVSTQMVSLGTVGETVTLHIRPDGDEAPGPSQG